MTAPLSAERVIELREQIRTGAVVIWSPDMSGVADIINIVERYSSLRAEMENLEGQLIDYAWLNGELLESKKKAEAENDKLITELSHHQHDLFYERQAREKAEAELAAAQMTNAKNGAVIVEQMAQLAKQAPLVEASRAVLADHDERFALYRARESQENRLKVMSVLRAALAYREKKGEKK